MAEPKRTKRSTTAATATQQPTVDAAALADDGDSLTGSERAYGYFLPQAAAAFGTTQSAAPLLPYRGDADLAFANVKVGAAAILAERERIARELPTVSFQQVAELPALALALLFATVQIDRKQPSSGRIADLVTAVAEWRRRLLAYADALVAANVMPAAAVEAIRRGRGAIDQVTDVMQLAALHRKYAAAAKGMTPLKGADLRAAGEVAGELIELLRPGASRRRKALPAEVQAAIVARDQLWTLLVHRYDAAWRVGVWIWGRDVDAHLPALAARKPSQRRAAKKPTTT